MRGGFPPPPATAEKKKVEETRITLDLLLAIGCGQMAMQPSELYALELREFQRHLSGGG